MIVSLAIAVLVPAHAFFDGAINDLRVDVVVDLTAAGRAIVRPTPERISQDRELPKINVWRQQIILKGTK